LANLPEQTDSAPAVFANLLEQTDSAPAGFANLPKQTASARAGFANLLEQTDSAPAGFAKLPASTDSARPGVENPKEQTTSARSRSGASGGGIAAPRLAPPHEFPRISGSSGDLIFFSENARNPWRGLPTREQTGRRVTTRNAPEERRFP